MLLRLATLGALGYAAYRYYDKNREQVDRALRRLSPGDDRDTAVGETGETTASEADEVEVAGGPLSSEAKVVHAGEEPVA